METQVQFKRAGKALGSNFLVCNKETPKVYIQVLGSDFETDDSGKRPQTYLLVKNLTSNETEKLWIGGQLEHTLSKAAPLKGKMFEIIWAGIKPVVDETSGEVRDVNNYTVFPLTT